MSARSRITSLLTVCMALLGVCWASAGSPGRPTDATAKTVVAAKAFLATLDDAKRAKVGFPFDSALKDHWSNFPVGMVPRNGVRWGDLNGVQRAAALALLGAALSRPGLQKVQDIMNGDEVVKTTEGSGRMPGPPPGGPPPGGSPQGGPPDGKFPGPRGERGKWTGPHFGRDEYYLAFFGAPSLTDPWMIQFGGHHLAINLTMVGKESALTPSLPAAQPASYKLDGRIVRPLGREHDQAFALINALDAEQRKQAILPYQVSDLVLGPGEDGKTIQPEGIPASALNATQQAALLELVHEWVGIINDDAAAAKMAEVRSNLRDTWFAWSGPTTSGSAAYFRIQGPTVFIEYAPQRSRGEAGLDGDHIHTIYRDHGNDYGARLLPR